MAKKRRGLFCWCCGRVRPNEAFSGRGHARRLCKACSKLGAEELAFRQNARDIDQLLDWDGLVRRKGRKAFERFLAHPDPRVRAYAETIRAGQAAIQEELARDLEMQGAHEHSRAEEAAFDPSSIEQEIEHAVDRARRGEVCVVTLGELVFFSARCGDAWMLDHGDGLAAPLCLSGDRIRVEMEESGEQFRIAWPYDYRLDGDAFVAGGRDGSYFERRRDYPVAELRAIIARLESPPF